MNEAQERQRRCYHGVMFQILSTDFSLMSELNNFNGQINCQVYALFNVERTINLFNNAFTVTEYRLEFSWQPISHNFSLISSCSSCKSSYNIHHVTRTTVTITAVNSGYVRVCRKSFCRSSGRAMHDSSQIASRTFGPVAWWPKELAHITGEARNTVRCSVHIPDTSV